jgi:hypothetical protein
MSADANDLREASSSAFPFAIRPRGQLAAVIDAPLQMLSRLWRRLYERRRD